MRRRDIPKGERRPLRDVNEPVNMLTTTSARLEPTLVYTRKPVSRRRLPLPLTFCSFPSRSPSSTVGAALLPHPTK